MPTVASKVLSLTPTVLESYNRRSSQFWTEGLQWHEGYLYESTGKPNTTKSHLNKLKLEAGRVMIEKQFSLSSEFFGEGLARSSNSLYQLTQSHSTVFTYNLEPLKQTGSVQSTTKMVSRWGLCFDSLKEHFYVSDGSAYLSIYTKDEFIKDNSITPQKLHVTQDGNDVYYLNDLEYANGYIYAAVMSGVGSNEIVKINAQTGNVVAQIDAKNLREAQANNNAYDINGIAYFQTDPKDGRDIFLITGKYWSKIFKVKFTAS